MIFVLLFCLLFLTLCSCKGVIIKGVLTTCLLILSAFWVVSNMFTGKGLNYAVYYHIVNSTEGVSLDDIKMKLLCSLVLIALMALFIFLCLKIHKRQIVFIKSKYVGICYIFCFIGMLFTVQARNYYDFFSDIYYLNHSDHVGIENFYHIPTGNIKHKYNYVFIYAESMERTFRNINNINFQPKLTRLADESIDFTNIQQLPGMGWTMAGIVNTQCGIPLVMGQGNTGGRISQFLPGAQCIGSWLRNNGYHTQFIRGSKKEFAGSDKFFSQHGWLEQKDYQYFIDKNMVTADQISGWGVHDDRLTDYAWQEFVRLSSSNSPFLLSFLTVNTHPPMGNMLDVCQDKIINNIDNEMLKSVSCSDYLLSKFIENIIHSKWYNNTIIVLVSDHLMMGSIASPYLDPQADERRNTFMVFKKGAKPQKVNTAGSLLDVWPTVLDIAGESDKKIGFGHNLLDHSQSHIFKAYVQNNIYPYMSFATALWNYPKITDDMIYEDKKLVIGDQKYTLPLIASYNENNRIDSVFFEAIARNMELLGQQKKKFFYAEQCPDKTDLVCAYNVSPNKVEFSYISPQGVSRKHISNVTPLIYTNKLYGVSSGIFGEEGGVTGDYNEYNFSRGINAMAVKSKDKIFINVDTCQGAEMNENQLKDLYERSQSAIILSSYDSLFCGDKKPLTQLAEIFHDDKWNNIDFRQQIIGVYTPEKKESIIGKVNQPLDVFVDLDRQKILSICQTLTLCP